MKVDPTEEWPRFRLTRFKKDDGARYFGPYAHAGALRQTLNFMRKKFGVLTFGRGAPTERELKSSTYQVPMQLSEINAEKYRQRVAQAAEFLEGHSREMIDALEDEMQQGGGETRFREGRRAAQHAGRSAPDDEADAAFHAAQPAERDRSAGRCPGAGRCAAASASAQGDGVLRHFQHLHHARRRSMVAFRDGVPDKNNYRRYRIKTVEGQDDFASMAEVVRRRYARVLLAGTRGKIRTRRSFRRRISKRRQQLKRPDRLEILPRPFGMTMAERRGRACPT